MMIKMQRCVILALLVLLPPVAARAQAPITVAFRLTLAGPVGTGTGFSVLYYAGASYTPTEAVFCGQALLPGRPSSPPCRGQSATFTQRAAITAGTPIHFDIVQSAPVYALIMSGTMTPSADTTIVAGYPHAASAVPVTFQLTAHIKLPGGVYFAVTYPYSIQKGQQALFGDLPLCSTTATPRDRAYAKRCLISGGISSAIVFLPPGTTGSYVFYAFRWGKPACLASSPGAVHVAHMPILVSMRVIGGGGGGTSCWPNHGSVGSAGLQFD